MPRYPYRCLALLGFVGLLAGCQDKDHATLHGRVTLNGQPVPSGAITLLPVDKNTRTASCMIRNGEYAVELPPTTYRVSISSPQAAGGSKGSGSSTLDDGPVVKDVIPAHFNERTEITVTVVPGANDKDFDLESGKK